MVTMMRILGLLFTLITVNFVESKSLLPVKLRANVLQPDLEAISNYYTNIDNTLKAYIHWPHSITFHVRLAEEKSEKFLEIDGTYAIGKGLSFAQLLTENGPRPSINTYNCLYYKDGKFYVKAKPKEPMTEISPEERLYYLKQPHMTKEESYLAIRYFGRTEMKEAVKQHYERREFHYNLVLPTNPATFLLTIKEYGQHFLEYTFLMNSRSTTKAEGNLRVLIGKDLVAQTVKTSRETSRLMFDPKNKFKITIPEDIQDEDSLGLNDIFGVRMATVGFLAEHRGLLIRMLSDVDISGASANPDRDVVSASAFMEKVRTVEPRSNYPDLAYNAFAFRPRSGKLQMKGSVLVKWANYDVDKRTLDPECPFDIEFESPMPYFLFGSLQHAVDKICTDDIRLWPKGVRYTDTNTDFDIIMMHH